MQLDSLLHEDLVLTPGPVNLHPQVQRALSLPMIHHRTPEFDQILKSVLHKLKRAFQTQEHVFVMTSTGTGGLEALLVNTIQPGDEILCINSGKFGERWAEMAKIFGARVTELKVKWGTPVLVSDVDRMLKEKNYKAVLCQACETSTGVAHPIRELGETIHQHSETLFLVDGITAVGAYPLPMDQWLIDGLVGGSQKAFMLPTGLSMLSLSKKAWSRVETCSTPRFYFDLRRELKANQNGETYFSSNVTLIRALGIALHLIEDMGWDDHFLEISKRAQFTRHFAKHLHLDNFSQAPSNSLTALTVPENIDSQKLRLRLEEKYHITIMGGQDQLKGRIIRIGHMGNIQGQHLFKLFLCLLEVIKEMAPQLKFEKTPEQLKLEMRGWWGHA